MKNRLLFSFIILITIFLGSDAQANEPDSGYIFAYATDKNHHHNGLHFAWSIDGENWHSIGPEHSFVRSDYGRWGSEKKMFYPYLFQANDGMWHCFWTLNDTDGTFAHVTSPDLTYWSTQSYPILQPQGNCMMPEVTYHEIRKEYIVTWIDNKSGNDQYYSIATRDFKEYTTPQKVNPIKSGRQTALINGVEQTGTSHKVSWNVIDNLIKGYQLSKYKEYVWGERVYLEPELIGEPIHVSIQWNPDKKKKISDMLMGVFFEDINYAADGGIYAELLQNRDFEYHPDDREGNDKDWTAWKAWSVTDNSATFTINTTNPIHPNNKNYASLNIQQVGSGLINEGWDGIPIKKGEKYDFSLFTRSPETSKGSLIIRLTGKNGEVYGENTIKNINKEWRKYETILTTKETVKDARLVIIPQQEGQIDIDMVSLFPQKTFKGRKNGLREDLAQIIADIKPQFVRFPGGCVAHGDGMHNIYRWENTIGPLETRKPQRNMWGYHQTAGLGYFEYFQFCEDIGAEPVPVVAAGVPCQNSAHHGCPISGQQGGIPMDQMEEYIQTILNLIEYANGSKNTTWGRKRAEAGHPEPFNLKYIGVGNEDLISEVFEKRFIMIYNAIKKKHPEITVIGTVGPFCEGTDYVEGWKLADRLNLPMVDEHYYQSPGWYLNNQDYYDRYDRNKSKVYLGEYAAHIPGRHNNLETALCEALHLANVERNGDIVSMTSYAPLLAKEGYTQWNPDLIYFNNTEVKTTVGYFVQKLYGQNAGDEYIPAETTLSTDKENVRKRVASSIVRDSKTGDVIIKLVNLLPVNVTTSVDLSGIELVETTAYKAVLSGHLTDKELQPEESTITVNSNYDYEMPAHSFTVIRIKTK